MTGRDGLVAKKTTDKNGKSTTVYVNPSKGAQNSAPKKPGEGWATGSTPAAPASRAAVVSSPPTPATGLSGLAALASDSEYDEYGFDARGIHRDTRKRYDSKGFDKRGFRRNRKGRNRITQTLFDTEGRNRRGQRVFALDTVFDENGFAESGKNRGKHRDTGKVVDLRGYRRDGFNTRSGKHRETRTEFSPQGYDMRGFDREGFDRKGFNYFGFDREGFDLDGYDRDGKNRDGLTREQAALAAEHGIDADLLLAVEDGGDSE
jgi:hypothetical protein